MEGYGTLTFKNGTKFVGMFKNGLRHGDGSIYYKGSVEMGKWSNGKLTNKIWDRLKIDCYMNNVIIKILKEY